MKSYGLVLIFLLSCSTAKDREKYRSFLELQEGEKGRNSYHVTLIDRKAPASVFAIHAGHIEPGTGELARSVAGTTHNLYVFEGERWPLHITSTRFDDPQALNLALRSTRCLSLHGYDGVAADFCVGGAHTEKRKRLVALLQQAFPQYRSCELCCPPHIGLDRRNIANRCQDPGIQVEMGEQLRRDVLRSPELQQKLVNQLTILLQ